MQAVGQAVLCGECTLPAHARSIVLAIAYRAHERLDCSIPVLAEMASISERSARKNLATIAAACGEDPVGFIRDVVDRRRPVEEWQRALELHGGRRSA